MSRWIWPTALGLLVLAAFLPTTGGVALAVGSLVFAAVLALWTATIRRSITAQADIPTRLVHGEAAELAVTVTNRSRLPTGRVRVRVAAPPGGFHPHESVFEVALAGRTAQRLTVDLSAYGRGRWPLEPPEIHVADPWGLHVLTTTGPTPPPVIVLPAIVPIERIELPAASPAVEIPDQRSLLSDPSAIVGVRPYEPGDPLRSIHWPATAASGTLVRRETERAWARDLVVVLDLSMAAWPHGKARPVEAEVTVAASLLVDAVLHQRQPAGLVTSLPSPDVVVRGSAPVPAAPEPARFRVGHSRPHLDAMLVHLATSRHHAAMPLADLVRREVRGQQPGTTVAVITGDVTDALTDAMGALRSHGITPAVIHVGEPHEFDGRTTANATRGVRRIEVPVDRALTRLRL